MLDLFCGAGGSAVGYHRAGFDVVGVDVRPQPNYPFEFYQVDAFAALSRTYLRDGYGFAAIHASPPCQAFTQMSARWRGKGGKADSHVDLLTPCIKELDRQGMPYVIENVPGAIHVMRESRLHMVRLHGGMFGLGVHRPRLFASNVLLLEPSASRRTLEPIGVYGTKPDGRTTWRRRNNGNWRTAAKPRQSVIRAAKSIEEAREAMGIDWMDWAEIREAIPPAYTLFLGRQLMRHVLGRAEARP
jgi:DNA (cytosine-5)-methyltransferase 1